MGPLSKYSRVVEGLVLESSPFQLTVLSRKSTLHRALVNDPANISHLAKFGSLLGQSHRRWVNIELTLIESHLLFAWDSVNLVVVTNFISCLWWYDVFSFNPLRPHDALKHHFTSL